MKKIWIALLPLLFSGSLFAANDVGQIIQVPSDSGYLGSETMVRRGIYFLSFEASDQNQPPLVRRWLYAGNISSLTFQNWFSNSPCGLRSSQVAIRVYQVNDEEIVTRSFRWNTLSGAANPISLRRDWLTIVEIGLERGNCRSIDEEFAFSNTP